MSIWSAEIKELERLYESFKGQLPELEKELGQLIHFDDPNVILLYSRRCLEVIITDLCECELKRERGTEPLKGIIDKLNKEKKIPAHIASSMYGLNELSTYGTHPKDFDPEQVKPVLNNLDIIIKWYFKYKGISIKTQTEEQIQAGKEQVLERTTDGRIIQQEKPVILKRNRLLSGVMIVSFLVIGAIVTYTKIVSRDTFKRLRSEDERISVAVMPFQNLTNDTILNVWQEGVQLNLLTSLSDNPNEIKIRQIESVNKFLEHQNIINYASISPPVVTSISRKLDADLLILGNINKSGTLLRVNAQIIDPTKNEVIASFQSDGMESGIIQLIDSLSNQIRNYLIITKFGRNYTYLKHLNHTVNTEAFRYYLLGRNAFSNLNFPLSREWFFQALSIDSNMVEAILSITLSYVNEDSLELAKKWCLKAYELRNEMTVFQRLNANRIYSFIFETPYESIKYLKELLNYDDQNEVAHFMLGVNYMIIYQYDRAIPEYEKSLSISSKRNMKPFWIYCYTYLGESYHKTGNFHKETQLYKKAARDFPDDPELVCRQAILRLSEGRIKEGEVLIEKYKSLLANGSTSDSEILIKVAEAYESGDIPDKAEHYYRQAVAESSENSDKVNSLAYFLIKNDRNINEGLELCNTILETNPKNYSYLHTKGWGLYLLKKYKESYDLLQKSWEIRRKESVYDHEAFLHLEEAKKAVAGQE